MSDHVFVNGERVTVALRADERGGRGVRDREKPPLCPRCHRGRGERAGVAADGRPQYRCGACRAVHTAGHRGERWDPERINPPRPCPVCDEGHK